ncbi:citrate synthase family protein [Deinococcus sp. YIM 77859]|uniref:citrate/2-methylcitrate synthase n=1 Tax=Deinococcus sp. YIM 77859 TaxID=1540221 RepID=UPI0005523101|nr:citrate synthase family protein [Deinococcus sp. YIM 77859]
MASPSRTLTAAEATARLGVKVSTLYAYVSRGLIRSEPGPSGTRERRYSAEDVERLLRRQAGRRDPQGAAEEAVQEALAWGMPVLESALTCIADGRLWYRGRDVARLAETATVEEVAALLWTGDMANGARLPLRARLLPAPLPPADTVPEALGYALVQAGAHDLAALDQRPDALPVAAARILNLLYATLERQAGVPPAPDLPLHARLARTWGADAGGADLLRRALVLLADHELNASAFAARVAAGGGASLPHSALAALAAVQGTSHGLAGVAAYELLQQAWKTNPARALRQGIRRHAQPPGFGHRLYPEGDPRARVLLAALEAARPEAPAVLAAQALVNHMREETGEAPNIDLALAALVWVLGRGAEDTVTLFALGRTPGWLAHAIEARTSGRMIRPRARYVGRREDGDGFR